MKSILNIIIRPTCPETSTEKKLNVLLQNLMQMGHFEICILKLINKINISKTNEPIKFEFSMISIFKIQQNSVTVSPNMEI